MGLLNALGGGAIVYGSMAHQENMAQLQQQLDIDRAQRIEEMKRNFAAADRATQAREINAGAEGMIDEKIGRRFASSDAAVADAQAGKTDMPMTQEQLDVIAQSKAGARDEVSDADKLRARIAAGEKAGYDMTKERSQLVSLLNHEDVSALRRETEKNKHEYYKGRLENESRKLDILAAGGGRGAKGGARDDHWDDKSETKERDRSDKWLGANYKITNPETGKSEPDTTLIEKASLVRDELADRVGSRAAHTLVQRVISDIGRDKARGLSTDQLTSLAFALAKKHSGGGSERPAGERDAGSSPQKEAETGKAPSSEPAARNKSEYGLLKVGRLSYLEDLEKKGKLNDKEELELAGLRESREKQGGGWWKGRATGTEE